VIPNRIWIIDKTLKNYGLWLTCLFQQIDSDWEEIEMTQAERDIRRRLRIFKYAEESGGTQKK